MATANSKARCVICGKEKATLICGGCSQDFCYKHLGDHRQELSKELDDIEVTRDLFRQTFNEQISDPEKHSIIKQINTWERFSLYTRKKYSTKRDHNAYLKKFSSNVFLFTYTQLK